MYHIINQQTNEPNLVHFYISSSIQGHKKTKRHNNTSAEIYFSCYLEPSFGVLPVSSMLAMQLLFMSKSKNSEKRRDILLLL